MSFHDPAFADLLCSSSGLSGGHGLHITLWHRHEVLTKTNRSFNNLQHFITRLIHQYASTLWQKLPDLAFRTLKPTQNQDTQPLVCTSSCPCQSQLSSLRSCLLFQPARASNHQLRGTSKYARCIWLCCFGLKLLEMVTRWFENNTCWRAKLPNSAKQSLRLLLLIPRLKRFIFPLWQGLTNKLLDTYPQKKGYSIMWNSLYWTVAFQQASTNHRRPNQPIK